jgi:hypothetical protein
MHLRVAGPADSVVGDIEGNSARIIAALADAWPGGAEVTPVPSCDLRLRRGPVAAPGFAGAARGP